MAAAMPALGGWRRLWAGAQAAWRLWAGLAQLHPCRVLPAHAAGSSLGATVLQFRAVAGNPPLPGWQAACGGPASRPAHAGGPQPLILLLTAQRPATMPQLARACAAVTANVSAHAAARCLRCLPSECWAAPAPASPRCSCCGISSATSWRSWATRQATENKQAATQASHCRRSAGTLSRR